MPNSMKTSKNLRKAGFELLYEISHAIVSNRYLDEILTMIVHLAAQVTGSSLCSIMLLNDKKDHLEIKATQSLSQKYRSKPPLPVKGSVSGRAVLTKKPVVVLNVLEDKEFLLRDVALQDGLVSLLAIPMMIKNTVIGVFNCYTAEAHEFSEEEIQVLGAVANQAAMAIENTQLLADKIAAVEALEARKRVEKAKGILMKRHHISEPEAYRLLQKQSMDKRRSLGEVAEAIVVSAEIAP